MNLFIPPDCSAKAPKTAKMDTLVVLWHYVAPLFCILESYLACRMAEVAEVLCRDLKRGRMFLFHKILLNATSKSSWKYPFISVTGRNSSFKYFPLFYGKKTQLEKIFFKTKKRARMQLSGWSLVVAAHNCAVEILFHCYFQLPIKHKHRFKASSPRVQRLNL